MEIKLKFDFVEIQIGTRSDDNGVNLMLTRSNQQFVTTLVPNELDRLITAMQLIYKTLRD